MKLFHLLSFTKELDFGSSTAVTRLNLFLRFLNDSRLFREPAGTACYVFEAFSKGCIIRVRIDKFSSYLPIKFS